MHDSTSDSLLKKYADFPIHTNMISRNQSELHSSQNFNLYEPLEPSHQPCTIWKQTVEVQTSHCNQCKITTSSNHRVILGKHEKNIQVFELILT